MKAEFIKTPLPDVQITMTHEEAITLHSLMRKIGGDPKWSYRLHTQALLEELSDLGIPFDEYRRFEGLWAKDLATK